MRLRCKASRWPCSRGAPTCGCAYSDDTDHTFRFDGDLNCGLRDKELRELRWQQIDLVHKKQLTVGKSKTDAGTGRVIPLNETVMIAL
jgi:integrase